jgi:3-phosphoshikimate 1-carboxyvinyltransferase
MRVISLSHPTNMITGSINLPTSKSISNRALILKHVLGTEIELLNLSEADDTKLMQEALQQKSGTIHLKNAGTCMRFLTAYFAAQEGNEVTLLCDERMQKRPIDELVNALLQMGAEIEYVNTEGFPPLRIKGKKLNGGTINISASASSQFVSALMMIAPLCQSDLSIELTGQITSQPYIEMTMRMMEALGITVLKHDSTFDIRTLKNNPTSQISTHKSQIEPDWSAASYWYELAALSEDAELFLPNLSLNSLQGDCVIAEYMELFGVETIERENGIVVRKGRQSAVGSPQFPDGVLNNINLVNCPDLAPTLAVCAAATKTPMQLVGLQNLSIKESNRLKALQTELTKLGFDVVATDETLILNGAEQNIQPQASQLSNHTSQISTYTDHRMAMAFAPLALLFDSIAIENPEVVEKSYPQFWADLKQVGFILT